MQECYDARDFDRAAHFAEKASPYLHPCLSSVEYKKPKLGSMRPAERKRMVDSVIGLDVIEHLGRWASEEALGLTREADAIDRTLVEPAKPIEPAGYRPSVEFTAAVDQLQALQRELDGLEGWLSHRLSEPMEPQCNIAWTLPS